MSKQNRQNRSSADLAATKIVIDESQGLVFASEEELYRHFFQEISFLEKEFFQLRGAHSDIGEEIFTDYEKNLNPTLENPDEIWEDHETIPGKTFFIYLKEFPEQLANEPSINEQKKMEEKNNKIEKEEFLFHVAICYTTNHVPSFVYLHFPSKNIDLVEKYCRGELIYDRSLKNSSAGALEGDALFEGDELAKGLYEAMQKLRSSKDIQETDFLTFAHLREETVETPDEIWRSSDSTASHHPLVNFIKEFPDESETGELWYIVVTIEDGASNTHALLFSFPTHDRSLVDRYRHGENLQADEVIQESSH